jgi:hypothetical protein
MMPGAVIGSPHHSGYINILIDGEMHGAHRLAYFYMTGTWPPLDIDVDHKNTVKTDNRWCNLRLANRSQTVANTKPSAANTSGYKGVSWNNESMKWMACIRMSGRSVTLGRFSDPRMAHAAYLKAAKQAFGDFARGA